MKVGVLGGGQLGRMLALAGYPLGHRFRFLDPSPEAGAGRLAELIVGQFDDVAALDRFADGLDVVSYEFENVPAIAAERIAARVPLFPPGRALEVAQDRFVEKSEFRRLGIATADFLAVHDRPSLDAAVAALGLPAVLKTRRLGYDGKGQFVLRSPADVDAAWDAIGAQAAANGVGLLLEAFVAFDRELSTVAVRARDGRMAFYPLVQNEHANGILRRTFAPAADVPESLARRAEECARALFESLDYVGVGAIELFQVGDTLLANEFAPRVHNSGHWTIEGAETSQFENHIRAVTGLPLGCTAPVGTSIMINLIGSWPDPGAVLAIPHAHLHLYDKSPAPGRKVGHVTIHAADPTAAEDSALEVLGLVGA